MCVNPLYIKSPAKRLHIRGGQKLLLSVPCGECYECARAKRNEWYFRTYAQVQDTLAHGGYVYFDTLTYSDEHIPHLSDFVNVDNYDIKNFTCFNRSHFRDFLKRLRIYLKYHYGVNDFKYFLTSEYAVDPTKTRRPHYHILFFVNCPIAPYFFSLAVAQCWHFGITDGLPYKTRNHVARHTYGFCSSNTDFPTITKVCNYVSKYITKNRRFNSSLKMRMEQLRNNILDDEELRTLKRNVDMFHAQSQGFGLSYLYSDKQRDIEAIANDTCVMYDTDKIINVIPLPMYYRRKLYYVLKQRPDKTYYWEKTDKGIQHDIDTISKRVKNQTERLYNDYTTLPTDVKTIISQYLADRPLEELAIYQLFYKGRLRDIAHLPDEFCNFRTYTHTLTDDETNLLYWVSFINQSSFYNSTNIDVIDGLGQKKINYNNKLYNYDELITLHTFNEDSSTHFRDFDKVIDLFNTGKAYNGAILQASFDYIEELKEKYKTELLL